MLQQTRVETVIPYFERFLARFPDVRALAASCEEEVLALWSGLGYYRRARSLREAARRIEKEHAGGFPRSRAAALALPGIGPYTAGAVLSIAYGSPEPLVDGNVARLFARVFGLEAPLRSTALERELWRLAEILIPPAAAPGSGVDPSSWNQGLMELGATVCTPRKPRCLVCPLRERCVALETGRVDALPRAAPKRELVDVALEVLWIRRTDGRVLIVRRPPTGRMAGMWELPTRELAPVDVEPHLWPAQHPGLVGARLTVGEELASVRHGITHHRIRATVRGGSCSRGPVSDDERWVDPGQLAELPLTGLTIKILKKPFVGLSARSPQRPG